MSFISLPAKDAARVLHNALVFASKDSMEFPCIRLAVGPVLAAAGTDGLSAGTDYQAATGPCSGDPVRLYLSLAAVAGEGRKTKDNPEPDPGLLSKVKELSKLAAGKQDVTILTDQYMIQVSDKDGSIVAKYPTVKPIDGTEGMWEHLGTLLTQQEIAGFSGYCDVNPERLAAFGKVETPGIGKFPMSIQVLPDRAWRVKIGPTFRGLFMPLQRPMVFDKFEAKGFDPADLFWGVEGK